MSSLGKDTVQQLGNMSANAEFFIIAGYSTTAVAAGAGAYIDAQVALGAGGSDLFGTAYQGSYGLLNGNAPWGAVIRLGGTFNAASQILYFGLHGGAGADTWHWDWFEWWP